MNIAQGSFSNPSTGTGSNPLNFFPRAPVQGNSGGFNVPTVLFKLTNNGASIGPVADFDVGAPVANGLYTLSYVPGRTEVGQLISIPKLG